MPTLEDAADVAEGIAVLGAGVVTMAELIDDGVGESRLFKRVVVSLLGLAMVIGVLGWLMKNREPDAVPAPDSAGGTTTT
jgi:uncharacterized membrane protein YdcZ (DUF606 family)